MKYFTELLKSICKIAFLETAETIKIEFLQTYVNSFYLLSFFLRLTYTKYLNQGSFENKLLTEYQIHWVELYNLSDKPTRQQVFPL